MTIYETYIAGNGNRGIGGYFWYTPLAEKFSKIPPPPPLEILGQAAILFFK